MAKNPWEEDWSPKPWEENYAVVQKRPVELDSAVEENMKQNWTAGAVVADNPLEAIAAGWDMSVAGLLQHRPRTVLPKDAKLLDQILAGGGQLAGDLIPGIVGFVAGGTAGAAAGGATGPAAPVASPVLAIAGAGAGSNALPEGMRQVLIDHYQNGELESFNDFLSRSANVAWNTGKAGIIGGVSGPLGAKAAKVVAPVAGRGAALVADTTTQAVSATALGAGMEGRVPNRDDFVAGAALALGFHAAGATVNGGRQYVANRRGEQVAKRMQDIYAKTGIPPWEQAERARTDPSFRQEIFAEDVNGQPVAPQFTAAKPREPEPYKPKAPAAEPGKPTQKALPNPEPPEGLAELIVGTENSAGYAKRHGINEADVVSHAGAVGRYQIMPDTARQYMGAGFDVRTLRDPAVNEKVGKKIIADLANRYRKADGSVDVEAVLIAYNAGPGRANAFIRNGRNYSKLPTETQRYLQRADSLGAARIEKASLVVQDGQGGGGGPPVPPSGPKGTSGDPENALVVSSAQKTREELEASVLGIIAEDQTPSFAERAKGLGEASYDRYVSELGPGIRLDKQLGLDGENTIGVQDVFRSTYASGERAGHLIKYGGVDPITFEATKAPAYLDQFRVAQANGGTERGLIAYRLAKHNLNLQARGLKVPEKFNADDARALVTQGRAMYEPANKIAQAAKDGALDYGIKSGMLSPKGVEAMRKAHPDHIPSKRPTDTGTLKVGGRSRGFQSKQTIQKLKGSDREIIEPLYAELESIHSLVRMSDRNNAIAFLVDPNRQTANRDVVKLQFEIIKALGMDPNAKGTPQFQRQYERALSTVLGIRPRLEQPPELLKSWDYDAEFTEVLAQREGFSRASARGDNTFTYFKDGVGQLWEADDPAIAAMIRGGNPTDIGTLQGIVRWFATLQRTGITAMPDYMIKAIARDQMTTSVAYKWGGLPFQNFLVGLPEVIGGTPMWKEFVRTGGMGSALADMDLKYIQGHVNQVFEKTGVLNSVANSVKNPIEAARYVMERLDAMSRVGLYKRQLKAGTAPFKAAMRARTSYLDFAERGTSQLLNSWSGMVPFLRPAILGLDQLAGQIKKDPLGMAVRASAMITVPTVALWVLNYYADKELPDGEKYSDQPRWLRDNFWITPPINGVRFRFPKPREIGLAFGTMYERMLDHAVAHQPKAFEGFAEQFITTFLPPTVMAAATPVIENVTNHSLYTGRPLIPSSLEEASNYMQYTAGTSETAINLSRVLGPPGINIVDVSPIVLQNYVRQWTGSVGSTVLTVLDWPQEDPGTVKQLADVPFVKSFILRHNDMGAAPIEDFYAGIAELRHAHRDLALAIDRNDPAEIDFTSKNAQAFVNLSSMTDAMRMHQRAIKAINANPDMTVDEKRERIDDLYTGIVVMAKSGNAIMASIEEK